MNKSSPTFCMLSHSTVALQNFADFCSCNVNKDSWKNNKHEVINIYKDSVTGAFDSYTRKIISTALDHGRRHPSCQHCWNIEDSAGNSPRQQFNQQLKDLTPDPHKPKILIIKPGNTCNLACRMCNPATSTSWYADAYKFYSPDVSLQEYTKTFELIRNSYNKDNLPLWETLKSWMDSLVYIDIYGGEPFLATMMFDLLDHGVNSGNSKHIDIGINTNATILNDRYIKILKQYQKINFKISIDSHVPEQSDYIRHKSNYDTLIKNVKYFQQAFAKSDNVSMQVVLTVTSLNIFYIEESKKYLEKELGLNVGFNIVTGPDEYYDIRHLPVPIKNYLKTKLTDSTIIEFLSQTIPGCDIEWPNFCRATDKLDLIRSQSFSETFPEWWNMLKPYWVK